MYGLVEQYELVPRGAAEASRSAVVADPENRITAQPAMAARSWMASSMPLMPGITTSVITNSGGTSAAISSAAGPS